MDNDDMPIQPQSFTRYVEKSDFDRFCGNVDTRFNKMETTFHGPNGNGGIVADIHILKTEWQTSKAWMKWLLGSSAIGLILSIANILKLFGII